MYLNLFISISELNSLLKDDDDDDVEGGRDGLYNPRNFILYINIY